MAEETTIPREKVEALAGHIRHILACYDEQRKTQALMIRACVERITRDPDHGVRGNTSQYDRILIRRKNNKERLEAIEGLRTLARMLDPA